MIKYNIALIAKQYNKMDDNALLYGLLLLVIFMMLCGKGMEWYLADKEKFNVRGQSKTSDLTNDYGLTNMWNERADKRKDHEEGLRYNYHPDLKLPGEGGSRVFEAVWPRWKPTYDRLAWRDAAEVKGCLGYKGLDADTIDKYILDGKVPSAGHFWAY